MQIRILLLGLLLLACHLMAGPATLTWDPNPESDLGGYRLYWGPAPRSYTNVVSFPGKGNTNSVELVSGTYYFAVTAYSTNGLESDYSNEVRMVIKPGAPKNLRVILEGVMFETRTNKTIPPTFTPVARAETIPGTSLSGTFIGPWGSLNRTVVADADGFALFPGKAITNQSYGVTLNLTRATIPLAVVETKNYP